MSAMRQMQRGRAGRPAAFEADPRDSMARQMLSVASSNNWKYDPQTGQARDSTTELEALKNVFGNPNRTITTQVGDSVPVENDDYLDAFMGKSKHSEMLIERVILEKDMSLVSEVFPFERLEGIDKTMHRVKMNNHLLRSAPEETGPHLVTHQQSSSTISLDRRNIGATQEKGFWRTSWGQEIWAAQLRQIGRAVKETAVLSAYTAVFGQQSEPEDPNEKYRVRHIDSTDMAKLIAEETSQFGALNKRCAEIVYENAQRIMSAREDGTPGNYALFPFGAQKYFEGPLFDRKFIETGHPIESADQAVNRIVGKSVYREARGLKVGDGQADLHLESQEVMIGNDFVMNDRGIENVKPSEYRTSMETVMVYDESSDRNVAVKKIDAFFYAGLGERNGESSIPSDDTNVVPLSKFGKVFFNRFSSMYEYFRKQDPDNYWLQTLLVKTPEVQAQFARMLLYTYMVQQNARTPNANSAANQQQLNRLVVQARMSNKGVQRMRAQATRTSKNRSRQNMGDIFDMDMDSSSDEEEDEEPEHESDSDEEQMRDSRSSGSDSERALKHAAGQSSWSESVRDGVMSFFGFLKSVEKKFPMHKLTKSYSDALQSMSSDDVHMDTATWEMMAKQLLEVDEWQSATSIVRLSSSRGSLVATPFEEEFVQLAQKPSTSQSVAQLRAASKMSPYWQSREQGAVRLKVLSVPGDFDSSTQQLMFPALSYTLSSAHLVLFSVEEDVLESLRASGGKVLIANTDAGSDLRDGLLQYSVTLSAIYQLVADSPHNDYAATLGSEIVKLVSRKVGASQSTKQMIEVSDYVKRQKLQPMVAQMWAKKAVLKISKLMYTVYHTKKGSKLDVSREARDILREVQACCDTSTGSSAPVDEDEDDSESGLGTSSRMRSHMGDRMALYARTALKTNNSTNAAPADLNSKIDLAKQIVQAQIAVEYPNPISRRDADYIFGDNQEAFEQLAVRLLGLGTSRDAVQKHLSTFSAAQKERLKDPSQTALAFKIFRVIAQNPLLSAQNIEIIVRPLAAAGAARDAQKREISDAFDGLNLINQDIRARTYARLQEFDAPAAAQAPAPGAQQAAATPAAMSSEELMDAMKLIEITDTHIFTWMMRHDVYVPIVFVVARPFVRLQVASAALLQSGGVLGKTYYANPMTEVGNDANTMMVFLHLAMYLKTGVEDPSKMILMRNILIQGYRAGNDTRWLDPLNSDHVDSFKSGKLMGSMIAFAEDTSFDARNKAIDITGEFHPSWHADDHQASGTRLTMARALGEHFGWKQAGPSMRSDLVPHLAQQREGRFNTFCLPCQCAYWNNTRGDWSRVFANAGHYGADGEYDGSGKVRNMQQTYYTPPAIAQTAIMV